MMRMNKPLMLMFFLMMLVLSPVFSQNYVSNSHGVMLLAENDQEMDDASYDDEDYDDADYSDEDYDDSDEEDNWEDETAE